MSRNKNISAICSVVLKFAAIACNCLMFVCWPHATSTSWNVTCTNFKNYAALNSSRKILEFYTKKIIARSWSNFFIICILFLPLNTRISFPLLTPPPQNSLTKENSYPHLSPQSTSPPPPPPRLPLFQPTSKHHNASLKRYPRRSRLQSLP